MEPNSNLLQPGLIFAERYRIERFLAQGGFGAVYVAEQLATELRVALKVLWPQVLASADAVEKFKLEARVASRINSDYIVRVFDAGFDAGSQMPFLVMELLQGQDLDHLVANQGPLAPEQAVLYLSHVAAALDKAHTYVDRDGALRPIVHRDLKPENLFLTHREHGEPVVKVLDFGIAKVLGATTDVSREVKGSPLFMAYEQIAGQRISPQTDVWALGLITFYLLTGQHYWNAPRMEETSITALFGEILSLPLIPPSERLQVLGLSAMPAGFDDWFFRCVNRDAALRFESAGAAIARLAALFHLPPTASVTRVSAATASRGAASLGAVNAVSNNSLAIGTDSAVILSEARTTKRGAAVPLLIVAGALLVGGAALAWWRTHASPPESSNTRATAETTHATTTPSLAQSAVPPAVSPLVGASANGPEASPVTVPLGSGTAPAASPPTPAHTAIRPREGRANKAKKAKKAVTPSTGTKGNVFDER